MKAKVKEGKTGFIHGRLQIEGSVFDLEGHKFSDEWMEKVKQTRQRKPEKVETEVDASKM